MLPVEGANVVRRLNAEVVPGHKTPHPSSITDFELANGYIVFSCQPPAFELQLRFSVYSYLVTADTCLGLLRLKQPSEFSRGLKVSLNGVYLFLRDRVRTAAAGLYNSVVGQFYWSV
jgi:hypothetical protein